MRANASLIRAILAAALVLTVVPTARGQESASPLARAVELMKNRQYVDAIKLLRQDMQGKPEEKVARQMLMLGECYYVTKSYAEARPLLAKAAKNLTEPKEKVIAEYRLACTHFRMNDFPGAEEKIDTFIGKYPDDSRVGTLLLFKMLMLARQGAKGEDQINAIYKKIANYRRQDHSVGMEADQILCDFYKKIGQEDKAQAVYVSIVNNFRRVIADMQEKRQPVPPSFEKSHDNAALQLGLLALERRQPNEATRWLDNVRYDMEHKARARLLLARLAYERKDLGAAVNYLTENGFIDMVPAGQVKSDMYLMLGLCEKAKEGGNAAVVEEHLRKVGAEAKGYLQAQSVLGDLYLDKGLTEYAVKCYTKCLASSDWTPHALAKLADIEIQQAADDPPKAAAHYKKAAAYLSELFVKHALTTDAKQSRSKVELLVSKGIEVTAVTSTEDLVGGWERVAKEKRGSTEAAQALTSIMRHHFKAVLDEKKRMAKAPNFMACAAACDRLLDEKTYSGKGLDPDAWKAMRGEVLFHRATCELASVAPPNPKPGEAPAVYLPKASLDKAIDWFTQAKALIDRKQADLVKATELGLLEAMFKSDKTELREKAEKRITEIEADYGSDPRFQRLAMTLAEWYADQGRFAEAARQYLGIAERGKDLSEDEQQKIYFSAGTLYSKAAYDLQQKADNSSYCIYIYPKAAIEIGDDALRSYPPLQRQVEARWPNDGIETTAREALVALSQQTQIPFVWSPATGPNTVSNYLAEKKLSLTNGRYTVAKALMLVLDATHHRLTMDIGLTGGEPTLPKTAVDPDDPEAAHAWQAIEIYDHRQESARFKPLAGAYGSFQSIHAGRKAMLFDILERIEKLSGTRIIWAEGIDKQDKLGAEYATVPGSQPNVELPCATVLTAVLEPRDLRWRIMRRDRSADYYDSARDCFNRVHKIKPKSDYGEKAIFRVSLDYFNQREYSKMKAVLRGYLKIFDNPTNQFYHQACFWIGWSLENERKLREACNYYSRAAEERLVILRPDIKEAAVTRDALKAALSSDTQFALFEEVSGEFKEMDLAQFARWVQLSARVDTRLDPSAVGLEVKINRPAFRHARGFNILCETLEKNELSFKVENVDAETAEKSYYRMALVYRKNGQMDQALENCRHLLARYPKSDRVRDVQKLLVDVYRGLRDFRKVLATLEELRSTAKTPAEKRSLDNEVAAIYLDMADYRKAAEAFKSSLEASTDPVEKSNIRAAYARCLFRSGQTKEAAAEYAELAKQPGGAVAGFIHRLMHFYFRFQAGEVLEREFPEEHQRLVLNYEKLTEPQRNNLTQNDLVRVTWVYYVQALMDLKQNRREAAMEKFRAAANSPDDSLAGEAGIQLAQLHLQRNEPELARGTLEYLLISVRATESSESIVRATYMLGLCHEKLDQKDKATVRFQEIVDRYPQSPFAELAQKHPLYRPKQAVEKPQ